MPTLLDTHAWLWWVSEDRRLSTKARTTIAKSQQDETLSVSLISVWELARKIEKGQLVLDRPLDQWLDRATTMPGLPDSAGIIFSAKAALWRLAVSAGSTAERLPFVGEDGVTPAVSRPQPGGRARLAYLRSFSDTNVQRIETATSGAATATPPVVAISSTRRDEQAGLSPDAQRVVFTSDRSGELEMWVADAGGGNPVQLSSMSASPGFGRWSPDGKTIAFHSNPDGQGDVFVLPADGGKPRNLTNHPATDVFPSFSGDGHWIYFSSTRTGQSTIWKLPVSGGDAVRVSPGVGLLAIESPDGAYLYYAEATTTNRSGPLVQLSLKDGVVVRLPVSIASTSFAVIEGGIYHIERAAGDTQLKYFDLSTHQSTVIARNLGNVGPGLTASRDGRSILYSRVDSAVNDLMLVENFR